MNLALNNLQRLICHKTQTNNHHLNLNQNKNRFFQIPNDIDNDNYGKNNHISRLDS